MKLNSVRLQHDSSVYEDKLSILGNFLKVFTEMSLFETRRKQLFSIRQKLTLHRNLALVLHQMQRGR